VKIVGVENPGTRMFDGLASDDKSYECEATRAQTGEIEIGLGEGEGSIDERG
jgi:hypothetical protein